MYLENETSTLGFGASVARLSYPPLVIHLRGDLGTGKTTFARGFIRALGHSGRVKSPTFSLQESYVLEQAALFHFDLYRIQDPAELEFIGIRDAAGEADTICLIEWPERGAGEIPEADVELVFRYAGEGREVDSHGRSAKGRSVIKLL
ncbi:MAG: tRNA (adenosine(37)-N6)-threonylcarbamoyltransferase complex ATPase subunit type 1 TsaE [Gammaproteobacteria bacterium]|nr:tRNA (adenosine(37)-N6)-threonylcarbamoyltransferase complex ATPase subunit type 1 TsaE [Gammaproteobacteria bacterium]